MDTETPDAHFAAWMRANLDCAAEHFGLTVSGDPVFGWRLRSISARVTGPDGARWLRVVSQEPEWASGDPWTGTVDANAVRGIRKPRVLDVYEWSEARRQRAEVMTLLEGELCSPTDVLHGDPRLSPAWWDDLSAGLQKLASTPTRRVNADQSKVIERIGDRFGAVDATVTRWATVHGDLHWANLLRPDFGLLDWELWGRGPAGTDAATLLCFSLLVPHIVDTVRARFAYQLEAPAGRVAQLYVAARLLRRVDQGDFPELKAPLERLAAALL